MRVASEVPVVGDGKRCTRLREHVRKHAKNTTNLPSDVTRARDGYLGNVHPNGNQTVKLSTMLFIAFGTARSVAR